MSTRCAANLPSLGAGSTGRVGGRGYGVAMPTPARRDDQPSRPVLPEATRTRVQHLLQESRSAATRRAYLSDWTAWTRWCELAGQQPRPAEPDLLAAYLADASQVADADGRPVYAPSTLSRWVAGINYFHLAAGLTAPGSAPVVAATLAGIRREASRPVRRSAALTLDLLRQVLAAIDVATWPAAVTGHRDRLVLLLGFTTAMRRSELAGLTVGDVTVNEPDGLVVRLRRSKTDQEGHGAIRPVPVARNPGDCVCCAWATWRALCRAKTRPDAMRLVLERPTTGHLCTTPQEQPGEQGPPGEQLPLLRTCRSDGAISPDRPMSGAAIHAVVRRRTGDAGLDPTRFGAHSLRAGFVTQALRGGADFAAIMRQTGHTSPTMVQVYARENDPLRGNAVTQLGL